MSHTKVFLGVLVLPLLICGVAYGQEKPFEGEQRRPLSPESVSKSSGQPPPPLYSPQEPVNCEVAGRYIDDAVSRVLREKDTHLIIIIRPGRRESSQRINHMRTLQVKAYMEYIRLSNYLIATGEKANGQARIDLYVGGKLLYSLPIRKNQGLNLLSCIAV